MRQRMTADLWALTLAGLRGEAWPMPPALPGRRIECRDAPLTADELSDVTSAAELGLLLGVTRQRAHQILSERAEKAQKDQP